MKRLSLRHFLMLLYLGSVVPLLIVVGLLVYAEYRIFLISEHSTNMRAVVNAIAEPPTVVAPGAAVIEPNIIAHSLTELFRDTDFEVTVRDVVGRPIRPTLGSGPWLDLATLEQVSRSQAANYEQRTASGVRFFYVLPLRDIDGNITGYVESNFPQSAIAPDVQALTTWLIVTIGGAIVIALLCAPAVATIATRPLARLVTTAQQVSQGNLEERAKPAALTELHELATTLNTMLDQIQRMMHAEQQTTANMQRFIADASHELRSPLSVLSNGLEVLSLAQQHDDHEQIAQTNSLLQQEIERMRRLIEALLLLARMDRPATETNSTLNLTEVDPLPLLEEIVERGQLLANGQHLQLVWPQAPIAPLRADPEALRQVLNNLLENSLRHTSAEQSIVISAEPTLTGCWLIVADSGAGIASEHVPHLFDRFYRVDDVRTREPGGTGLGLAIVRAIVTAHGGQIEVASTLGKGTRMAIWLPTDGPITHRTLGALGKARMLRHPPEMQQVQLRAANASRSPHQERRRLRPSLVVSSILLLIATGCGYVWFTDSSAFVGSRLVVNLDTTPVPIVRASATPIPTIVSESQESVRLPTVLPRAIQANGFEAAAELARQLYSGEKVVAVEHEPDEGATTYKVLFHNFARVTVDLDQQQLLNTHRSTLNGNGRGAENRRVRMGLVVAALARGSVQLNFDQAAERARQLRGEHSVVEVALEWEPELNTVIYSVEFSDGSDLELDPRTGAMIEE